jgi:hypothetical protein
MEDEVENIILLAYPNIGERYCRLFSYLSRYSWHLNSTNINDNY